MEGTIITKKGIQLLAKLLASDGVLNFTRAAVGTGKMLPGYDPANMLDLVEYRMNGAVSKCEATADVAKITMQISSDSVINGFIISEAGLYAEDPDEGEILYAYIDLSDDPQYMYAEGGQTVKFMEITLDVVIDTATKISAVISPNSMVNRREFEERMEGLITVQNDVKEIKEAVAKKIDASKIANNGTTTEVGYALDARQANPNIEGTLANQVSQINSKLPTFSLSGTTLTITLR